MDVDTRLPRYFVAVAEHLSFTAAAEELHVARPSLSRQIKQLESRLGTDLFVRASSTISLTAAGRALLPAARRQLAAWQDAVRLARTASAAERNLLRRGSTGVAKRRRCGTGWPMSPSPGCPRT